MPGSRPLPSRLPSSYLALRPLVTTDVRAIDEAAADQGLCAQVLMEHAGWGVAELARLLCPRDGARVLVLAGPGNNGGDGYAAARLLSVRGAEVEVLALAPARTPEAQVEARLAAAELPVRSWDETTPEARDLLAGRDLLIDALFGVGLVRPLAAPALALLAAVAEARAPVLSVDVPSGLCADTGRPLPSCVRADVTAALVAPKRGYAPGAPGAPYAGHVVTIDLGLPRRLLAPFLAVRA